MPMNYRIASCQNLTELFDEIENELIAMNVPAASRVRNSNVITLKMDDDPADTNQIVTLSPYADGISFEWAGRYKGPHTDYYRNNRSLAMNTDGIPVDIHIFSREFPRTLSIFFNDPVRNATMAGMILCNLATTAGDEDSIYMFAAGANNTTSAQYGYEFRELFNANNSVKAFIPNGHNGDGPGGEGCYWEAYQNQIGEFWRPDIAAYVYTRPTYQPGGFKLMHPLNIWVTDMELRSVHLGHIADHYRINRTDLNFGQEIQQAGKRYIIIDRHSLAIEIV